MDAQQVANSLIARNIPAGNGVLSRQPNGGIGYVQLDTLSLYNITNIEVVGGEVKTISSTQANGHQQIHSSFSVNDDDADPENEIQDLALDGDVLTITNNATATPISLLKYLADTTLSDAEVVQIVLDSGFLQMELDTIALAALNDSIADVRSAIPTLVSELTNDSNFASVSYVDSNDDDNQNLSLGVQDGTLVSVNIDGGSGVVVNVADEDNSSLNELQTGSWNDTTNEFSLSDGNTVQLTGFVDDASTSTWDKDNTNESPYLNIVPATGASITITDLGGGNWEIDEGGQTALDYEVVLYTDWTATSNFTLPPVNSDLPTNIDFIEVFVLDRSQNNRTGVRLPPCNETTYADDGTIDGTVSSDCFSRLNARTLDVNISFSLPSLRMLELRYYPDL
ncbi:MAG: hypothetical protein AAGI23_09420 [Bacteroidota bacterium]